jgi:hypothetical protein
MSFVESPAGGIFRNPTLPPAGDSTKPSRFFVEIIFLKAISSITKILYGKLYRISNDE